MCVSTLFFFFFQAEDGIRDIGVTGVQTCALPIFDSLQVDITNTEKLLKRYDKGRAVIISESGIGTPEDIQYLKHAGADAFLVGTSIMQTPNIGDKISKLYYAL